MPLLYELSCVQLLDIKSSDPCCYKDTFSARCFAYFFWQCSNHAHKLGLYCGGDDLKTPTSKLEFSDLNLSATQPVCVLSSDLNPIVWLFWLLTQPLLF